ncbi:MAG: hypothetical protein N3A38_12275 [Planctomycetota bacterium]|nr:hypothetical protein [Planctomycetota bacterium]
MCAKRIIGALGVAVLLSACGGKPVPRDEELASSRRDTAPPPMDRSGEDLHKRVRREFDEAWASADRRTIARRGERFGHPVNVMLIVSRLTVPEDEAAALDAAWKFADERLKFRGPNLLPEAGLRIGYLTGAPDDVTKAVGEKSRNLETTRGLTTTVAGKDGMVPVALAESVEKFAYDGKWYGGAGGGGARVRTLLIMRPVLIEDLAKDGSEMFEIAIAPAMGGLLDGDDLRMPRIATTILVPNGGRLIVGGTGARGRPGTAVFQTTAAGKKTRTLILLGVRATD